MCRIDLPFGNHSLDEKKDPYERFVQALDENEVDEPLRSLLLTHLANNYGTLLFGISQVEEALKETRQYAGKEKCAAFLGSGPIKKLFDTLQFQPDSERAKELNVFLDMLRDVAKNHYKESLYQLWSELRDRGFYFHFDTLFTMVYGEDYLLSEAFFNDFAILTLREYQRNELLWGFFSKFTHRLDDKDKHDYFASLLSVADKHHVIARSPFILHLIDVSDVNFSVNEATASLDYFLKGFEFLKAWVEFDARAGSLFGPHGYLFDKLCEERYRIGSVLSELIQSQVITQALKEAVEQWWNSAEHELEMLIYIHANLSAASDEQKEQWGEGADRWLSRFCFNNGALEAESYREFEQESLIEFCSKMEPLHIETWIEWSVKQDIQAILANAEKGNSSTGDYGKSTKWCLPVYAERWKEKIESVLGVLTAEEQLFALSARLGYTSSPSWGECQTYLTNLRLDLVNKDSFPKELIPEWTSKTQSELDDEQRELWLDKSIGILRSQIASDAKPRHYQQLKTLLESFEKLQPAKALRHRLMLMRVTKEALSDESLALYTSLGNRPETDWYRSLHELTNYRLPVNCTGIHVEDWKQIELDAITTFSKEVAEFCLSRLRLRKGQKAKDGQYTAEQVTESSSIWRQGYLYALLELGFDLNGKVHKTVNFTSKADPSEDVCAIAKKCYRAVRRATHQSETKRDLERGLIAAQWWLLLCQRQELGLDFNPEQAKNTRRRLLR